MSNILSKIKPIFCLGLYAYYTLVNGTGIDSYVIRAEYNQTKVSFFLFFVSSLIARTIAACSVRLVINLAVRSSHIWPLFLSNY